MKLTKEASIADLIGATRSRASEFISLWENHPDLFEETLSKDEDVADYIIRLAREKVMFDTHDLDGQWAAKMLTEQPFIAEWNAPEGYTSMIQMVYDGIKQHIDDDLHLSVKTQVDEITAQRSNAPAM